MAAPNENNPLWMLFIAHFCPCDIIFQHYQKTRPLFFNPATQDQIGPEFLAYTHLWLALLFVVADGFKELGQNDPAINSMIDDHLDELRIFRNSVFHFQRSDRKRTSFHEVDHLNWAQNLHAAFRVFFTSQQGS